MIDSHDIGVEVVEIGGKEGTCRCTPVALWIEVEMPLLMVQVMDLITPVDEEAVPGTVEGDNIAGVEFLVLDKSTPSSGYDIALAAAPVRVAETPYLSICPILLEVEEKPLVRGGGVLVENVPCGPLERKVFLSVLLGNDQAIKFSNVARGDYLVEHVLLIWWE